MGFVRLYDVCVDEAGNVSGGASFTIKVYQGETASLANIYADSAGADPITNDGAHFHPMAGMTTTLLTQAAPADTSLHVTSTSGWFVGDRVALTDGANTTEHAIIAIPDGTHFTLDAAVGGAHTYAVATTNVGDIRTTGEYTCFVADTQNYTYTITDGSGVESRRKTFIAKGGASSIQSQQDGVNVGSPEPILDIETGGIPVTVTDDVANTRIQIDLAALWALL